MPFDTIGRTLLCCSSTFCNPTPHTRTARLSALKTGSATARESEAQVGYLCDLAKIWWVKICSVSVLETSAKFLHESHRGSADSWQSTKPSNITHLCRTIPVKQHRCLTNLSHHLSSPFPPLSMPASSPKSTLLHKHKKRHSPHTACSRKAPRRYPTAL